MRRIAIIDLGWSLAKPPDEQEKDKFKVAELLRRIGKGRKFNPTRNWCPLDLDVESPEFAIVFEEINKDPDIGRLIRIEHQYAPEELEVAPLLIWGPTNQAIEDDWYDLEEDGYQGGPKASHKRCSACRAKLEQVRDLLVDVRKMGKRDLSLTYESEVILSARLARMLQESGLTGFTLRPVWDYRKPYQGEPRLFQLVVTNVLPPMASPPTEFEEEWPKPKSCAACGTEAKYLKHIHWWGRIQYYEETNVYYPREVLETAADFNKTLERFGDLPASDPYVIISQRAYRWLQEQRVKGWKAEPVYLVE